MLDKEKYNELIEKGWNEFDNDNYDESESICNQLIENNPDFSGGYYLLGHINFKKKQYEQALKYFTTADDKTTNERSKGYINYWIARLYEESGLFEEKKNPLHDNKKANAYYEKAREFGDYPKDLIYKLRYLYRDSIDKKLNLFKEGIDKFPEETAFYISLSYTYTKQDNLEMALKTLNDAIEKKIESSSLYYNIGELYFSDGQFSVSRNYFENALRISCEFQFGYAIKQRIGDSYYKEGNYLEAERYYKESYYESKEKEDCWFGFCELVVIYNEQHTTDKLVPLIKDFIINKESFGYEICEMSSFWLDSKDPEGIFLIHELKDITSIFRKIKLAIDDTKVLCNYWLIRAKMEKSLNRYSDYLKALKSALKYSIYNNNDFILKEIASVYIDILVQKIEKHQDTTSSYTSFISDIKSYPTIFKEELTEYLSYYVEKLFEVKDYKKISDFYQLFTKKQITKANIWFEVAYSLNELKHKDEAKQAYQTCIKEKGETTSSLNNLANIYDSEENYEEAIRLYKKALEIDPNDELIKRNLKSTLENFKKQEQEINQRKALESSFKLALKTLKSENNFVIEKLSKFIFNLKQEDGFSNWKIAIQQYKFPKLMETDKQKAESLKEQWIKKNYITETDERDSHNVIIYVINPYIESEITKINNNKIPENWINGFSNISTNKLEELEYFELTEKIDKITDEKFKSLIERDLNELFFNYLMQNKKATIVLSGSLIELSLMYYYNKQGITQVSYSVTNGKTIHKQLSECILYDLIMYSEKKMLFGADFQSLTNLSRIYRNYIHPGKELKDELSKSKSDLCFISVIEILKKIL